MIHGARLILHIHIHTLDRCCVLASMPIGRQMNESQRWPHDFIVHAENDRFSRFWCVISRTCDIPILVAVAVAVAVVVVVVLFTLCHFAAWMFHVFEFCIHFWDSWILRFWTEEPNRETMNISSDLSTLAAFAFVHCIHMVANVIINTHTCAFMRPSHRTAYEYTYLPIKIDSHSLKSKSGNQ